MKKLLLLSAVLFSTTFAFTQDKGKDYITMKPDGKVYWIRSGKHIKMNIDVPLKNGSVVNYKGNVTVKDGEMIQLKEGDKLLMDGTMVSRKSKS